MEEKDDSTKADITKNNLENIASTIDKTFQMRKAECLAKGEAIMPNQADKNLPSSANTVVNSASTRQSVARRRVSRPLEADNSPTTPQTLTTTNMVECS